MDIPYIVIDQLTPDQQQVWKTYFGDADRPRYIEEGLWRRTQEKATAEQSGWTAADDARRRIIHYRYRYGLVPTTAAPAIGLTDLYLYHSATTPLPLQRMRSTRTTTPCGTRSPPVAGRRLLADSYGHAGT